MIYEYTLTHSNGLHTQGRATPQTLWTLCLRLREGFTVLITPAEARDPGGTRVAGTTGRKAQAERRLAARIAAVPKGDGYRKPGSLQLGRCR